LELAGITPKTDPINIVPVPGPYHLKIHTNEYYEWLEEKLAGAWRKGGPAEIRKFLQQTGCDIANESLLIE
jgi:hypothetical protein